MSMRALLVHKLDRLARNRGDDVAISVAIKEAGARLVSCTENIDETPSGSLMHSIIAGMAEYYSKNLAVEVKKGLQQKARTGGTPGRVPIGYLNTRKIIDGQEIRTVDIDPERAPHIEWMFKAYATGQYTISELVGELNVRGCRTRRTPKVPSKPLGRSVVHRLLSNPYYVGIVRYGGVDYEGNHDPIVDLDTFRAVQTMLITKRTAGDRTQQHQHYLKGSLFCGHCGAKMALTRSKGRTKIYSYFYCLGRNKNRTDCRQGFIGIDKVEQAVEQMYVDQFRFSEEWLAQSHRAIASHIELTQTQNVKEVARQQRRLQALDNERRKLLQAHYADAVPADLMREEQERIGNEQASAQRLIESCTVEYERMNANLDHAIDKLANMHVTYKISDDKGRRKINQGFFEKMFIVDDDVAGVDLAGPYLQILDEDLAARISAEQKLSPQEQFEEESPKMVIRRKCPPTATDDSATSETPLPSKIRWHPYERPHGPTPLDSKNPAIYLRRRGSNLTLLAEGVGFEPTVSFPTHAFQACRFGRSRIPPGCCSRLA